MRCRMTASLRATATLALRSPLRLTSFTPQAFTVTISGRRSAEPRLLQIDNSAAWRHRIWRFDRTNRPPRRRGVYRSTQTEIASGSESTTPSRTTDPDWLHHADRCLLQRHVQSDIVLHCRSPSLRGHMRLASYVPGELIPLPLSGSIPELPHVEKVENRTTSKFSRKSISWRSSNRCRAPPAPRRRSVIDSEEAMRSLTSPRAKRISGPRKFRSPPQKDFFQQYRHLADFEETLPNVHFRRMNLMWS